MKISKKINEPISKELKTFQSQFFKSVSSNIKLLDLILRYILKRKGKQIRPVLVLLFGKMISKEINPKIYRAANLVELIHTASLVHDDIVDEGQIRRKFLTINALWKNKVSVLVGDFFLSKALLLSTENKDYDLLDQVSKAVKEISEGELYQIQKSRSFSVTEKDYLELISKKTAALFSCCCAVAAISSNSKKVKEAEEFGKYLGIIFQIKDDLFDYGRKKIGKPRGIDIKEKKLTLPLIYSINNSDRSKKRWLINSIKKHSKDKKVVKEIINYVKDTGGLEYAIEKMSLYHRSAIKILEKFPKSKYSDALKEMIDYVIERDY